MPIFADMSSHKQVFGYGQVFENTPPFHDLEDATLNNILGISLVDNLAHKFDITIGNFSLFGFQKAGDRFQGRCFTGTIGP